MADEEKYQRAYARERKARQLAESILDEKTRETYNNFLKIKAQNQELESHKKELEFLIEVASFSKDDLSFSQSLSKYQETVAKLLNSPYGLAYLKADDDDDGLYTSEIIYPNNHDFPEEFNQLVKESYYFSGKSIPGQVLKYRKVFVWTLNDDADVAPLRVDIFKKLELEGSFSVPIIRFDQVVAVIEFGIKDFSLVSHSAFDKIQASAYQLGVSLERREQQKAIAKSYLEVKKAHDDLKVAQSQLVQSEKMSSLGQIAAGVAHEINNPIGFVNSNMQTLKEYIDFFINLLNQYGQLHDLFEQDNREEIAHLLENVQQLKQSEDFEFVLDDLQQMINDSSEGLMRVKDIVANLKNFAHADDGVLQEHDINECLENSIKVVWNELKYTITLHRDFNDIPKIVCSIGELSQVFMNMLINAKDACGEQGEITVSTHQVDNQVEIRFADNGSGIPKDKLNKIFDPFFTTKPIGKGTGLGLSVSYGIIEKHNGSIDVETEAGKGTCFIIKLPI